MKKLKNLVVVIIATMLCSCSMPITNQSSSSGDITARDMDIGYEVSTSTKITLADDNINIEGSGATAKGSIVTISSAGIYIISGELSDGQILVNATSNDKVQIVLQNATIHSNNSAPIYVKQADKVFITLDDSSNNLLSDSATEYVQTDDNNVDAVIFSKDDLTINGNGKLTITSLYKHAVVSKDDLVITGGEYEIKSNSHAFYGKDCVKISGGTFNIESVKDAIQSDNNESTDVGNVLIMGGTFTVKAGDDAFHAENSLVIDDGDINIISSNEGLEGNNISINGGDIIINATDDGINAAGNDDNSQLNMNGAGGIAAPIDPTIQATPTSSLPTKSSRPADNMPPAGGRVIDENRFIKITGGNILINANGDGIDSNGNISITGGNVYVSVNLAGGDSALDYDGRATITGGTFIGIGGVQMAQNFGTESTQCALLYNLTTSSKASGTSIKVIDKSGKEILTYSAPKDYQSVLISSPQFVKGETYQLVVDTETIEITLTDIITSVNAKTGRPNGGRQQIIQK